MVGKRTILIIDEVRSLRSLQGLFNETPSSDGSENKSPHDNSKLYKSFGRIQGQKLIEMGKFQVSEKLIYIITSQRNFDITNWWERLLLTRRTKVTQNIKSPGWICTRKLFEARKVPSIKKRGYITTPDQVLDGTSSKTRTSRGKWKLYKTLVLWIHRKNWG